MGFTAKLMAERTQIGDRQSISEGEYMCHVFVRADSLIGVCLSDQEYPKMVAHKLLTKVSANYVIFSSVIQVRMDQGLVVKIRCPMRS